MPPAPRPPRRRSSVGWAVARDRSRFIRRIRRSLRLAIPPAARLRVSHRRRLLCVPPSFSQRWMRRRSSLHLSRMTAELREYVFTPLGEKLRVRCGPTCRRDGVLKHVRFRLHISRLGSDLRMTGTVAFLHLRSRHLSQPPDGFHPENRGPSFDTTRCAGRRV